MFGLMHRRTAAPVVQPPRTEPAWDPWFEWNQARPEIEPLLRAFFGPIPRPIEGRGTFTPPVDLYETAEELVLRVYLPGMSPEDVHLEVVGDTIHVWGERKPTVPEKEVTIHLAQLGYGTFDLRYALPVEVQTERCTATYRSGIIEVHLPKVATARPQPVEIRVEG
jgi:HSP20 family protein